MSKVPPTDFFTARKATGCLSLHCETRPLRVGGSSVRNHKARPKRAPSREYWPKRDGTNSDNRTSHHAAIASHRGLDKKKPWNSSSERWDCQLRAPGGVSDFTTNIHADLRFTRIPHCGRLPLRLTAGVGGGTRLGVIEAGRPIIPLGRE